ncbi:MAG TPA: imidazole glycerol phosphate synthase subunit HisH [Verrucomicrobiae bacterium]|nr:imidazole glycerol phosphate synthase subunit HisH [Verrucomicrobiae bacterium]
MIAIIDYGRGNLRSVQKGMERFGYPVTIADSPEQLDEADGIILPGVGAFADAMRQLRELGFVEPILRNIQAGKPFLGICLGMQVLFAQGEEHGIHQGLGVFPGIVMRFPAGLKVPHMGWNQLDIKADTPLLAGVPQKSACYFVHSYFAATPQPELVLATSDYGVEFPAIVGRDKVFGVQFHPEKSSDLGLAILNNFGGMVEK